MDKTAIILFTLLAVASMVPAETGRIPTEHPQIEASIEVSPNLNIYSPGDRIESITATILIDGIPTEGASIKGIINGINPVKLDFKDIGNGKYRADINYVIPNEEKKIIEADIDVYYMASQKTFKKWLPIDVSEYFSLLANKPTSGDGIAPGQPLEVEAQFGKINPNDKIEGISIKLIDIETGKQLEMGEHKYGLYRTEFLVPDEIGPKISLLVVAQANVNGKPRYNYYDLDLNRDQKLVLAFDRSKQDTESGKIALEIRYVSNDGSKVRDKTIDAQIEEYPGNKIQNIVLKNDGGTYIGTYKKTEGAESAKITFTDSLGNSGQSYLPSEFFKEEAPAAELPLKYLILIVGVIIAAIAITLFSRKSGKTASKSNYSELKKQKEELKEMIATTKKQYYKQKVTEDVANRTITEYEEKISLINKQLEALEKPN